MKSQKRAQRRKYHYFYKTTCLITNKYYYGMHSTDNLDDGYLGSGRKLWHSINKHGRENHKIEILEFFDSREKLKEKEISYVNENLLKDPMCMNLQLGGGGGFINEEHRKKCSKAGALASLKIRRERHCDKLKNDPNYRVKYLKALSEGRQRYLKSLGDKKMPGKPHSEETKQKMRESRLKYLESKKTS